MPKKKSRKIMLIIVIILCTIVIITISGLMWWNWFTSPSKEYERTEPYRKMFANTRCSIRQETKNMNKIPPNWNNAQMINSQYYPNSLKKPMYFQFINNPYQTFVATKWQWCKTIPKFYRNKPNITGEWKIINYHKTNKNVNLTYRWKNMPSYVTYNQNKSNIKTMTVGSPVKYKQGTCGSYSN